MTTKMDIEDFIDELSPMILDFIEDAGDMTDNELEYIACLKVAIAALSKVLSEFENECIKREEITVEDLCELEDVLLSKLDEKMNVSWEGDDDDGQC